MCRSIKLRRRVVTLTQEICKRNNRLAIYKARTYGRVKDCSNWAMSVSCSSVSTEPGRMRRRVSMALEADSPMCFTMKQASIVPVLPWPPKQCTTTAWKVKPSHWSPGDMSTSLKLVFKYKFSLLLIVYSFSWALPHDIYLGTQHWYSFVRHQATTWSNVEAHTITSTVPCGVTIGANVSAKRAFKLV